MVELLEQAILDKQLLEAKILDFKKHFVFYGDSEYILELQYDNHFNIQTDRECKI